MLNEVQHRTTALPVFVGGCDRSGTTIAGTVLGSQDKAIAIPESHFLIEDFYDTGFNDDTKFLGLDAFRKIEKNWRFTIWDFFPTSEFLSSLDRELVIREFIFSLVSEYGKQNGKKDFDFWVDHTPMNIMFVSWYSRIFPESKFIHLVRDPRAVAASILEKDWGPSTVEHFVPFWLQKVSAGLAAKVMLPAKVLTVRYEDLVLGTERTLERVASFLGWKKIDPHRRESYGVTNFTKPQHSYLDQTLQLGISQDWENFLSEKEVQFLEGALHGVMGLFEYQCRSRVLRNAGFASQASLKRRILDFFRKC